MPPPSPATDRRLEALYQITSAGGSDFATRLDRLLEFGIATFGLQIGIVSRIEGTDYRIFAAAPAASGLHAGDRFELADTYCARTVLAEEPVHFSQASGTVWERHPCFAAFRLEAYLGTRILVDGRNWGTLNFSSLAPVPRRFDEDDLACLRLMARWIGTELERETRQAELRALTEWQQAILDGANLSIIATAVDGTILSFNRAAERMLGYTAVEVVGKATPEIIHDAAEVVARAPELSAEIGATVHPGFEVFVAKTRLGIAEEREWTYIRKDGSRFPVLLSVTALRDDKRDIRGYLGIATDITLRKQLEAATAQARANDMARAVVHAVPEGIVGLRVKPPHRVLFLNPEAERLLGLPEADAVGRPLDELVAAMADEGGGRIPLSRWLATPELQEAALVSPHSLLSFPAAFSFAPVAGSNGQTMAVLTLQNITARRQAEQKLKLSDKVFEYSAQAIVITDPAGTILSVNPAFTWLTGYPPHEAVGRKTSILKSGRHDDAFYAAMWEALAATGHWEGELWDKRRDGSIYPKWLTVDAVREDGRTSHYVALFSDISERKENESRIAYLALHDQLTGLPNRRALEERAARLIASGRRRDRGLALMFLDLDRFKNINDTLGHQVGDLLLIEVARRLVACVRATDTVVRLGGDEFVVLVEDVADHQDVAAIARKIHASLGEPVHIDGRALHAPPSIGIALYPEDGADIETLMQNADTAMYQVKSAGRNAWTFYTPRMNDAVQERMRLESDLRRALADGEFRLHFQPQFDLATQAIIGWEALLRWPHPEQGWIPPDRFIPVAEETGLIVPLGDWVLRTACREARRWEAAGAGHQRVAVNLSARQFQRPELADDIAAVLAECGLAPERLEVEITESLLMADGAATRDTLQRLKALGVRIALDDFGTGYSSLAYLKTFAIDRLKIDRSFVRDLAEDANDAAIVRAVISLAAALGLEVIAEGVETSHQQTLLLDYGCTHTQGFLLGRPMPGDEVPRFLDGYPAP
ncbi:MAG: EAL domain-containing protein [Sterolibacteriaceae bacterium MAG5]|nr:EAL domain-containing protein [Candidatus Nitricoxidireducens bremensis]